MHNYEREFEQRLAALGEDSRVCATFGFTEFVVHFVAGSDPETFDRVNEHPAFWNGVVGGLQTATFVALGRIYDDDSKSHTASEVLTYAEEHIGIFSRDSLAQRKVNSNALSPKEAQQYATEAYAPKRGELSHLRKEFEALRELFREKVQPIRHQVFAHKSKLTHEARDELFTRLPMRELESLVVFPVQLHRVLWGLYHNGVAPQLESLPSNISDVMKNLPADRVNTWEHLHVARAASDFLQWLRAQPRQE